MEVVKLPQRELMTMADLTVALHDVIERIIEQKLGERRTPEFRWIPAPEAGKLLGISAAAVGARVRQGTLPGRLYARRIYVDRQALDVAIAESGATVSHQSGPDPGKERRPGGS